MRDQRELDHLKRQMLEYTHRQLKTRKQRKEMQALIEKLFEHIRAVLEGRSSDFEAEVRWRTAELHVTPGVRWRFLRGRTRAVQARGVQLRTIKGIGVWFANRFKESGVTSTQKLLELGATPRGRKQLAKDLGTTERVILTWVNSADLMRIRGVGEEYTDLLHEAGVDTVPELAQRKPANLYQKMVEVNAHKNLVRRLPSLAEVEAWVAQAKRLQRVIRY